MINFDYSFTIREIVLLSITFIFVAIQLYYYLVVYMRPVRYVNRMPKSKEENVQKPPVSIIVYARNEYYNLEKNLPVLLSQNYEKYEVIVINDGFTDESDMVLTMLERQYPNLYHTFIPEESKYLSRRKLSLTLGIKAAKYDILFFIEAHCIPMSEDWLSSMVKNYKEGTMIVLGYCAYTFNKGILHKLVGYDNLLSGIQYLSSAISGRPFSGNGRNLSYRKQLFFDNKGYSQSLNLHAGDDDLFVNQTSTSSNTTVEYSHDSITEMGKVECYAAWEDIKIARASTQRHYRGYQVLLYRFETVTSILFFLSFVALGVDGLLFFNPYIIASAAAFYMALTITKIAVSNKLAVLLRQKKINGWQPILEMLRIIINVYIFIYRTFKGKRDYTFAFGSKKLY